MTEILLLGDLILDVPEPDHWLSGIAPILRAAEVVIGHLEVPYTTSQEELAGDVPAPGADPAHLAALARAGVTAVSTAGNHMMDCGAVRPGRDAGRAGRERDCPCRCRDDACRGARPGADRDAADGSIALLSYNCVGPENVVGRRRTGPAAPMSACSPPMAGRPGRRPSLAGIDPASLAAMAADIAAARGRPASSWSRCTRGSPTAPRSSRPTSARSPQPRSAPGRTWSSATTRTSPAASS